MSIIGKVLPKYYNFLKMSGAKSFLRTTKPMLGNSTSLKLDSKAIKTLSYTQEEIEKAYQSYAKSPYVNEYLRSGDVVSENGNNIINCLNQAINQSEPTTGKFLRGLMGTRKKPINDDTIADYIFKNKGFTSTTTEKSFASSFASAGSNSAIVEFEITKPMKAFTANRWETIFAPNAFSSEKFEIQKLGDKYYKVIQK
jgi:hypothetical protein